MKIKHIKYTLLLSLIVFFATLNYFSLAAPGNPAGTSTSIDSDNDGLGDNEEVLYNTDPKNPDTDGDGYSDGVEVKSGYNPIKPAPGDRITTEEATSSNQALGSEKASLTDTFISDFQKFVASKEGQTISAEDVKKFTDAEFADKVTPTDINTLPIIEKNQIKIKSQNYSSLSESERKKKLQEDAVEYLNQIIYLFTSNVPVPITNTDDFDVFQKDFMDRLSDLSNIENVAYFSDMGNRLEIFSQQLETLEVPETMADMHIKFLRIIKGSLLLKNPSASNSIDDPMGKIIVLTKANDLIKLFSDLIANDFSEYFKQFNTN